MTVVVHSSWYHRAPCDVQLLALNQLRRNVTAAANFHPTLVSCVSCYHEFIDPSLATGCRPSQERYELFFCFPARLRERARKTTYTWVGWTDETKVVFWDYGTECTDRAIGHIITEACISRLRNTVFFVSICGGLHGHRQARTFHSQLAFKQNKCWSSCNYGIIYTRKCVFPVVCVKLGEGM